MGGGEGRGEGVVRRVRTAGVWVEGGVEVGVGGGLGGRVGVAAMAVEAAEAVGAVAGVRAGEVGVGR